MTDLDDAHDALDRHAADDDWLHDEHGVLDTLAPGWREPDKLAQVVAQADRLLADEPLPSWVTDRLMELNERYRRAIVRDRPPRPPPRGRPHRLRDARGVAARSRPEQVGGGDRGKPADAERSARLARPGPAVITGGAAPALEAPGCFH